MTGRRADGSVPGVQTLTVSQSSPVGTGSSGARPWKPDSCGGGGPKSYASRVPSQPLTGRGAWNRASPTGGSANGIPRKTTSPLSARPRTAPAAVRTSRPSADVIVELLTGKGLSDSLQPTSLAGVNQVAVSRAPSARTSPAPPGSAPRPAGTPSRGPAGPARGTCGTSGSPVRPAPPARPRPRAPPARCRTASSGRSG